MSSGSVIPVLISKRNIDSFRALLIALHSESGHEPELVSASVMAEYVARIDQRVLIIVGAAYEGRLIGYGALERRISGGRKLAVVLLSVLAAQWSKGVGTTLMRSLIRLATQIGETHLHLEVAEDNVRARRLYERLGFAYVRPFAIVGAHNVPHTVMRLDLRSSVPQPVDRPDPGDV